MIEVKCSLGSSITKHYEKIARMAKNDNEKYFFEGNGIIFIADKNSDEYLAEKYLDFAYTYELKVLGPDVPELAEDYKIMMDCLIAQRKASAEKVCKIREEDEANNKSFVETVTDGVIYACNDLSTYIEWKNTQTDRYGTMCFEYAERLAKLLQIIKDNSGDEISADYLKQCEKMLNYLGITGFQHSIAMNILKETWQYYYMISDYE